MQICHIPHDTETATGNMAIDATLLEFGRSTEQVTWRTYGWTEPAITFGYSQGYDRVCASMPGFSGVWVRRMTGGGIVDHRNDLTYALTIPPGHPEYSCRAPDLYRRLHMLIANVLMESGIPADLAPCPGDCGKPAPSVPADFCFHAAEPYDVIQPVSGAKIAGAAMKRNHEGVLIQGSLNRDLMGGLPTADFAKEFGQLLAKWLKLETVEFEGTLPADILTRELERFASKDWNRRR
jgi:lipoate-protein ligase A